MTARPACRPACPPRATAHPCPSVCAPSAVPQPCNAATHAMPSVFNSLLCVATLCGRNRVRSAALPRLTVHYCAAQSEVRRRAGALAQSLRRVSHVVCCPTRVCRTYVGCWGYSLRMNSLTPVSALACLLYATFILCATCRFCVVRHVPRCTPLLLARAAPLLGDRTDSRHCGRISCCPQCRARTATPSTARSGHVLHRTSHIAALTALATVA